MVNCQGFIRNQQDADDGVDLKDLLKHVLKEYSGHLSDTFIVLFIEMLCVCAINAIN